MVSFCIIKFVLLYLYFNISLSLTIIIIIKIWLYIEFITIIPLFHNYFHFILFHIFNPTTIATTIKNTVFYLPVITYIFRCILLISFVSLSISSIVL